MKNIKISTIFHVESDKLVLKNIELNCGRYKELTNTSLNIPVLERAHNAMTYKNTRDCQ
jgi:hypothetical protein